MTYRNWIWLSVVVLLLVWNRFMWRKLRISQDRLWQHFLTWKIAAFGVLKDGEWEEKAKLDANYGVECYKSALEYLIESAKNPFNSDSLKKAGARLESDWRRW
jgi:hypothetical protein